MKIYENLDINDLENEIWKVIEDFSDYYVSNLGRVKSLKFGKERILKQQKHGGEYFRVDFCKNGKCKPKQVHRLVFETHNNYKLKSDEDVHHIDFINILPEISKENNNLDNLMMMSKSEHQKLHMKNISKETKKKISEKKKGEHHSKETITKISESRKEKFKSGELKILRGENSTNHKLTEEQVIQIKLLLKEGILTQQEIADMFGVSQLTISAIKTGRSWSHIKL